MKAAPLLLRIALQINLVRLLFCIKSANAFTTPSSVQTKYLGLRTVRTDSALRQPTHKITQPNRRIWQQSRKSLERFSPSSALTMTPDVFSHFLFDSIATVTGIKILNSMLQPEENWLQLEGFEKYDKLRSANLDPGDFLALESGIVGFLKGAISSTSSASINGRRILLPPSTGSSTSRSMAKPTFEYRESKADYIQSLQKTVPTLQKNNSTSFLGRSENKTEPSNDYLDAKKDDANSKIGSLPSPGVTDAAHDEIVVGPVKVEKKPFEDQMEDELKEIEALLNLAESLENQVEEEIQTSLDRDEEKLLHMEDEVPSGHKDKESENIMNQESMALKLEGGISKNLYYEKLLAPDILGDWTKEKAKGRDKAKEAELVAEKDAVNQNQEELDEIASLLHMSEYMEKRVEEEINASQEAKKESKSKIDAVESTEIIEELDEIASLLNLAKSLENQVGKEINASLEVKKESKSRIDAVESTGIIEELDEIASLLNLAESLENQVEEEIRAGLKVEKDIPVPQTLEIVPEEKMYANREEDKGTLFDGVVNIIKGAMHGIHQEHNTDVVKDTDSEKSFAKGLPAPESPKANSDKESQTQSATDGTMDEVIVSPKEAKKDIGGDSEKLKLNAEKSVNSSDTSENVGSRLQQYRISPKENEEKKIAKKIKIPEVERQELNIDSGEGSERKGPSIMMTEEIPEQRQVDEKTVEDVHERERTETRAEKSNSDVKAKVESSLAMDDNLDEGEKAENEVSAPLSKEKPTLAEPKLEKEMGDVEKEPCDNNRTPSKEEENVESVEFSPPKSEPEQKNPAPISSAEDSGSDMEEGDKNVASVNRTDSAYDSLDIQSEDLESDSLEDSRNLDTADPSSLNKQEQSLNIDASASELDDKDEPEETQFSDSENVEDIAWSAITTPDDANAEDFKMAQGLAEAAFHAELQRKSEEDKELQSAKYKDQIESDMAMVREYAKRKKMMTEAARGQSESNHASELLRKLAEKERDRKFKSIALIDPRLNNAQSKASRHVHANVSSNGDDEELSFEAEEEIMDEEAESEVVQHVFMEEMHQESVHIQTLRVPATENNDDAKEEEEQKIKQFTFTRATAKKPERRKDTFSIVKKRPVIITAAALVVGRRLFSIFFGGGYL